MGGRFGGPGLMGLVSKLAPMLAPLGIDIVKIATENGFGAQEQQAPAPAPAKEPQANLEERVQRLQAMFPHYAISELVGVINAHPTKSDAEIVDLLLSQ